jgi:hypothetical protein
MKVLLAALAPYRKFLIAILVGPVASAVNHYAGPGSFASYEFLATLTALGVVVTPNAAPVQLAVPSAPAAAPVPVAAPTPVAPVAAPVVPAPAPVAVVPPVTPPQP